MRSQAWKDARLYLDTARVAVRDASDAIEPIITHSASNQEMTIAADLNRLGRLLSDLAARINGLVEP